MITVLWLFVWAMAGAPPVFWANAWLVALIVCIVIDALSRE